MSAEGGDDRAGDRRSRRRRPGTTGRASCRMASATCISPGLPNPANRAMFAGGSESTERKQVMAGNRKSCARPVQASDGAGYLRVSPRARRSSPSRSTRESLDDRGEPIQMPAVAFDDDQRPWQFSTSHNTARSCSIRRSGGRGGRGRGRPIEQFALGDDRQRTEDRRRGRISTETWTCRRIGKLVAMTRVDAGCRRGHLGDRLAAGEQCRTALTLDPADDINPVWSPRRQTGSRSRRTETATQTST